jgi:hypothetical protein
MYFLIETEDQLRSLPITDTCFVQAVPYNYNYNPVLSKACLFYYRTKDKGYIMSIDHSETFSLKECLIVDFIEKHKKVFLLNKKFHSKYFNTKNAVDLLFTELELNGEISNQELRTTVQIDYDRRFYDLDYLNKVLPITKHYEHLENLYDKYSEYIKKCASNEKIDKVIEAYDYVERSPIRVKLQDFLTVNSVKNQSVFIEGDLVYGNYNLYNQTGRPTNSFNGVNFLAIPKKEEHRKCIIPSNDYFVEFDFDAYHVRLIANELGIKLPDTSVHEYLAKQYLQKDNISESEYKQSKTETFSALYGNASGKHHHVPIIKAIHDLSQKITRRYDSDELLELPTGVKIHKKCGPDSNKIFNYYVQNLETYNNVEKILQLKKLLKGKKTRLLLITYDSFLFDYSVEDGKELLVSIKSTLEKNNTPVKFKYGKDYSFI